MAFEFRCPYGLVFDETKLVCEWPWLVPACSGSGSAYTREYDYGGYTSAGLGTGGYVTGAIPGYSVTTGSGYSGADYSRTTDTGIRGTSGPTYFGIATGGQVSGHSDTSASNAGTISGHVGLSSQSGAGYSGSTGQYGGSAPISTYSGPPIHVTSVTPGVTTGGKYPVPISGIGTGQTVSSGGVGYSGYTGGINTESSNIGISGSTGYSGAFDGDHLTGQGVTYSRTHESGYSGSTLGAHTGSVGGSHPVAGVSYSKPRTSYFDSTESLGPSTGIYAGATGFKHDESTSLYTGSNTFNAGGYSASTDVYSGATGSQPLPSGSLYGTVPKFPYSGATSGVEISGSISGERAGSTTEVYRDSVATGYSKAADGISVGSIGVGVHLPSSSGIGSSLQSTTGHVTGTNYISGASKPGLAPSVVPGRPSVTTADISHLTRGSTQFSATGTSSTGVRYDHEDGYTVPVFIQPVEPIYPSIGTTGAGVRDYTGTAETHGVRVTSGYSQPELVGPHLNVSIFNNIPTGYTTGAVLTGSSVEGSINTDNSLSGTILSYGNVPGTVSTTASDQGAILTGGVHTGYIATSSGTPGYVTDGVKKVDAVSASAGTIIYGTISPGISLTGPSTPGVLLKGDTTPSAVVSGQTALGVSIGGATQPGTIVGATGKPYVSPIGVTYQGIGGSDAATRGSTSYSSSTLGGGFTSSTSQSYKSDGGRGTITFNAPYDTSKYPESDLPDYRPTSATLPDSIVSGGRIESTGGVVLGSTLSGVRDSSTVAPGYFRTKPSVSTPSGFTKTGPTKTGITTAILGGGGSYSVSTSERRPILHPENIGEKAFDGDTDYTRTSSIGSIGVGLSSTLTPSAYSSTFTPSGRVTAQSVTSGYSYPKPAVKFETGGAAPPATPVLPIEGNLPVTAPTPFLSVELHNGLPDGTGVFGSKVPTVSSDRGLPTPTITPIIYTTKQPGAYKTTLFEAAKIPGVVSTVRPVIDTGYKTMIVPTNIPVSVLTEDRFTQRTSGLQTGSISTSGISLGSPFQPTDSSPKGYSSFTSPSPVLEYLPEKPSKPGVIASTAKYDGPRVTARPELGVTYKKPSPGPDVAYKSPSSVVSPTTFRPTGPYYPGQGFSTPSSLGTTISGGSPTNLDISKDEIDKLITNYRGTVKFTPSVYDSSASSGFDLTSTKKFSSSSSSVRTGSTFAVTSGPTTSSYEVTTKFAEGKGKVIVKWSDLHPLLLGKLGADCTCKADPFANLRGPGKNKLIASSRGKVDLANYDESDIYVDLESDRSSEEGDYVTNYGDYSPQPYKISPHETSSVATVSSNLPSSSYLPVSSTINTSGFVSAGTLNVRHGASVKSDVVGEANRLQSGRRVGKKLKDIASSLNSIISEEDDPDQIIDGATDCARPGLFRHPNLCNKFYACYWDQWKKKFTLHIFNCPIHLTFDSNAGACNWPSKGPACQADNLLV